MTAEMSDCLSRYDAHGVRFAYPGYWALSEAADSDGDILITVEADDACFWTLRILAGSPAPPDVVASCVAGFEEEYEDTESAREEISLAEMPAVATEVTFSCYELLNTAMLCSVRTGEFTLLVWWQGTDHELEEIRPIFEQMTGSVRAVSLLD